ncbi:MAG: hypothetical protein ACKVJU_24750 [Verrucomicrobiales bacterium]
MKILSGFTALLVCLVFAACNNSKTAIDAWDVEVGLLETTPFPALEEIQPYDDALVAHRYQLLSAVAAERESPALAVQQLIILHWAIRDKKPIESVKNLKQGDVKKFTIQRKSDRSDLNGRYIKNGIDDFELFLFVEAERETKS